jgi:hypothetical protein
MSDETTEPDTTPDTPGQEPNTTPDTPESEPDMVSRNEFRKVIEQRDKLKAKIKALSAPDTPAPTEPTEADTLRTALARTASVSVLVTAGIADKADQDAILSIPGMLSDLDVSGDGEVDTSALSERLDTLRRIFGQKAPERTVPRVRTGQRPDDGPADPDKARYQRIMGIR